MTQLFCPYMKLAVKKCKTFTYTLEGNAHVLTLDFTQLIRVRPWEKAV